MNAELVDGRRYTDTVEIHVDMAVGRYIADGPDHARMDTMALLISEERPRNAQERRQAALAVFGHTHLYTDYDYARMRSDIETMRKLGRTERWQNALTDLDAMVQAADEGERDTTWAILQGAQFVNYAA